MKPQINGRQFWLTLMLIGLWTNAAVCGQQAQAGAPRYKGLRRGLVRMGNEDQKHRSELVEYLKDLSKPDKTRSMEKYAALVKKQDSIDKRKLKRLATIVDRYGWPTRSMVGKEASDADFLIVQHADLASQKNTSLR